jgi:hypothetical protein
MFNSPALSCTTIHCSPFKLLFLPLLIHFFPCFHISLPSSPILSPNDPPPTHSLCVKYPTLPFEHKPRLFQSLTQSVNKLLRNSQRSYLT